MPTETKSLTLYPPGAINGTDLTNKPKYSFTITKGTLKYNISSVSGSFYLGANNWGTVNGDYITFTLLLNGISIGSYQHKLAISANRFRVNIDNFSLNETPIILDAMKDNIFEVQVTYNKSTGAGYVYIYHIPSNDSGKSSLTLAYEVPTSHTISYHNGTEWVQCEVYYHDGENWVLCDPYYHDGTNWVLVDTQ